VSHQAVGDAGGRQLRARLKKPYERCQRKAGGRFDSWSHAFGLFGFLLSLILMWFSAQQTLILQRATLGKSPVAVRITLAL
jgi:hypothetical protein